MAENGYECLRLENQLCFPLYACAKEIVRRYRPFLDELDLTYTQYIAMMVMWEYGSMSVKKLGSMLYLDSGTLTPLLKKLEEKDYISKKRDPEDDRVVIVSVTPEGMELRDRAISVPHSIGSCIKLPLEDAIELRRILDVLLKSFESEV